MKDQPWLLYHQLYRRLGGWSQSGLVQKIVPTTIINPRPSSHCTHYAVLAHITLKNDIMGRSDIQDPTTHKRHIKLKQSLCKTITSPLVLDVCIIFTFVPCILILSKFFYSPIDAQMSCLKKQCQNLH
jgi:hypothetical protein